jgi:cell division inhibitor SepF
MSMFRRAMDYLGLGPDDAYDDYDASVAVERPRREPIRRTRPEPVYEEDDEYGDFGQRGEYDDYEEQVAPARRGGRRDDSSVTVRPTGRANTTVKPLAATSMEAVTVRPVKYDEARDIADLVKSGRPVLMDIGTAEEPTARRLIDFVSGLVYGLEGTLEKVSPGVFLIKPRGVRVARG